MQHAEDLESFVSAYGSVYEHSVWVAEEVFEEMMDGCRHTDIIDPDTLPDRFESVFLQASRDRQLATLRAHPLLACAQQAQLTNDSVAEQSGAGLDSCTAKEFEEFGRLNDAYSEKFGFPFIVAVKGLGRQQILLRFRERMQNNADQEFETAVQQVNRIARFRLEGMRHD